MKNYQNVEERYFYDAIKGEKYLRDRPPSVKLSPEEREDFDFIYNSLEKPSLTDFIALILNFGFYGMIVFILLLLLGYFPSLEIYVGNL